MAKLYKTSSEGGAVLVVDRLDVAESLWQRGRGLLGRKHLDINEALWIKPGNNIHTFFMRFAIDVIFVDKKMEIKSIAKSVAPFRFVGPHWKASSVIEMQSGLAEAKNLKIGDQLYVVN